MADLQFATLLSMGYPADYIERAIDVHKKSKYGTDWNLSILVEIIGRLQEKDKEVEFVPSIIMQPPSHQQSVNINMNPPMNMNLNNMNLNMMNNAMNAMHSQLNMGMMYNNMNMQLPNSPHLQQSYSLEEQPQFPLHRSSSNMGNSYNDGLSSSSDNDQIISPIAIKKDIFYAHYQNIEEAINLSVNEFVDYRYENGRYLLCKIIAKSMQLQNMMLLHPVGKPIYDTKYDRLVDIYEEYYKLAPAKTVCLKKIESKNHIFNGLQVNDYIDINPYCNGHEGWKNGKIIKLDNNSSQIKVVYHHDPDNKNYSYWVHLLNHKEVAEFRSKCNNLDPHQMHLENENGKTARFQTVDMSNNEYQRQIRQSILKHNNKNKKDPLNVPPMDQKYNEESMENNDDYEMVSLVSYDDEILNQNIARLDVKDDEIAAHILKFESSKWEFNCRSVELYRIQSSKIKHNQMMPAAISIKYPQYFGQSSYPPKEQFFANVLPPKDVQTSFKKWRVRIIIAETTTTQLISQIVNKLSNSLQSGFNFKATEFMLKVVGYDEYLYGYNLIIDYEAVRKAVRNEDNVIFQLVHCPNFKQIEREYVNKNLHHIRTYKTKYIDAKLLNDDIMSKHKAIIKYCPYSYGDGKSLKEVQSEMEKTEDSNLQNMIKQIDDAFEIPVSDFAANQFEEEDEQIKSDSIFRCLPSYKDTQYLKSHIDDEKNEIFLHELNDFYEIKIMFLVNVTHFPLYKHHIKNNKNANKKWHICIRHELWIGDLCFEDCSFDIGSKYDICDGMRFTNSASFKSSKQKFCYLPKESCISFTVYLCNKANDEQIPIAFVRFPIVNECNLLRNGKYALNLWPIPVFIAEYKGSKCNPYGNQSFKYRGTTIDRHLNRFKQKDNEQKELQKFFKLGTQFGSTQKDYSNVNIIALPLNYRWNYNKNNFKSDSTAYPLINYDLLRAYTDEEKRAIWKNRDKLCRIPSALTAFLRCVDFRNHLQRSECYYYLEKWQQSDEQIEDLLELLSYEFMDSYVREYCIMRISQMHDNDIQIYLLQFVQCLKYELHHNNALIRLLMQRALSNPNQIGHFFFWHLKSEYLEDLSVEGNMHYIERFGLYLEEYLLFSPMNAARDILIQCNLSKALNVINHRLRVEKKQNKTPKHRLKQMLKASLEKLNEILPESFILPIQPKWRCSEIIVDECKLMSSAQLPIWVSLKNVDEAVGDEHIRMLFKCGDDLRQDILTLQILRVLDKLWLDKGLNLNLLPYNVVSTGDGQGMVEIVLNSTTTTHIHTHYGGGPQKGARDITTHLKYIQDVCDNNAEAVNKARDIYTRSSAGYCIASYCLGLGDRHPSNIMVRTKGELFQFSQ